MPRATPGRRGRRHQDRPHCGRQTGPHSYSCESSRVSSVRLFILDALTRNGEMHGHQLRQLAEKEHVSLWTDISVGSLYGALKRLAAEGLVEVVRTEQVGGYPERQVFGITQAGAIALNGLRLTALREVTVRPDPVDFGLARFDRTRLDEVPGLVEARIAELHTLLDDAERHARTADPHLTLMERAVLTHRLARLRAEIDWHQQLVEQLPELLDDEASRKDLPR